MSQTDTTSYGAAHAVRARLALEDLAGAIENLVEARDATEENGEG